MARELRDRDRMARELAEADIHVKPDTERWKVMLPFEEASAYRNMPLNATDYPSAIAEAHAKMTQERRPNEQTKMATQPPI